ncbi:hypothetical protein [Roseovarius salinarum]|uniref:hypothetical protein n=1 Tax=Roseovarius salinarum TaxID=1981892 RepID=UPI000C329CB0|nr:hypothetical protein [Roseovarius salinarum]
MTDDTRDDATRIATDGICRLFAEARREGIEDAETAVAAINAALACYEATHARTGARYAAEARQALARAETLRLMDLDARLIGDAAGRA